MKYYSATKKNDIQSFATTWMDLEDVMISEISQKKASTIWYHLYVKYKKYNKLVDITKKKQTHKYREQTTQQFPVETDKEEGQYRGRGLKSIN